MTKQRFTAAALAELSPLKLGPDLVIELLVDHTQEGCHTVPRRSRALVQAVHTEGAVRNYLVLFPLDTRGLEGTLPTWEHSGHVRVVPHTRLKIVARTNKQGFRFGPLEKRAITARSSAPA